MGADGAGDSERIRTLQRERVRDAGAAPEYGEPG